MAVNGGGRLVAWDADGRVERIEPTGRAAAAAAGVPVDFGQVLTSAERSAITDLLAERIVVAASGVVDAEHLLAGGLPDGFAPEHILLSGGVAQLVSRVGAGDPGPGYGDLGQDLARSLHARLADLPAAVRVAADAIHATVVGAAQFSVQVSGNTLHVSEARLLPVRNLPVAVVPLGTGFVPAEQVRAAVDAATTRLDLDDYADPVALAVEWDGMPRYATLRALADGIASAHRAAARAKAPLVLAMTSDVAANLGAILQNELAFDVGIVVVDGVEFADLDFIDIGERILPANVVPLLIKSLLFVPREPLTPASQAD
jgi:ethanolamine utilization protein EutA